jgi:hypothetical protein
MQAGKNEQAGLAGEATVSLIRVLNTSHFVFREKHLTRLSKAVFRFS